MEHLFQFFQFGETNFLYKKEAICSEISPVIIQDIEHIFKQFNDGLLIIIFRKLTEDRLMYC